MLNAILVLALASEPDAIVSEAPGGETLPGTHFGYCTELESDSGCYSANVDRLIWCLCDPIIVSPVPGPCPGDDDCSEAVCEALGDGHYECPNDESYLVPASEDEEVVVHVRSDARSADGWECSEGWCSLDYGLVSEDDDVVLPGEGAQCDEQAPDSCEPPPSGGSSEPPPKPRRIWIKTMPRDSSGSF
jgi:hypothetical protein